MLTAAEAVPKSPDAALKVSSFKLLFYHQYQDDFATISHQELALFSARNLVHTAAGRAADSFQPSHIGLRRSGRNDSPIVRNRNSIQVLILLRHSQHIFFIKFFAAAFSDIPSEKKMFPNHF